MINSNEKELFSSHKFEDILKNKKTELEQIGYLEQKSEIIYFRFSILVQAGYYLRAIELINEYFSKSTEVKPDLHLRLLFLLSEAYLDCINYSEVQKVLEILKEHFPDLSDEYSIFIIQTIDAIVNKAPNEFSKVNDYLSNLLEKIIQTQNSEKIAFCLLKRGVFNRINQKYDEMISDFNESLKYYSSSNNSFGMAKVYYQLGYSYINLDKLDQSLINFEKSADLFKSLGNLNQYSYALSFIGHIYSKKGNLKKAKELLVQSLNVPRLFPNDFFEIYTKEKLADNYTFTGELDIALEHYFDVSALFRKTNLKMLGGVLNKIGKVKSSQGKFEDSLEYHKEALKIFTGINDLLGVPWTHIYVAESLFEMGDFDSTLVHAFESYKIFHDLDNNHGLGFVCLTIGKVLLVLNDEKSIRYYKQAMDLFEEMEILEGLVESYIGYGIILEEQEKFEESEIIHEKARAIIKSNEKRNTGIGEKIYNYSLLSLENSFSKGRGYIDLISSYLDKDEETKLNKQRKTFIKAVKLNFIPGLREKLKALDLFESITKEPIIDYYTSLMSYLYILEEKIFELKIFNNFDIIQDAEEVLEDIMKLTSANAFSSWAIRAIALKAQIKLIEFKYDEAKKLLNDALQISVGKNMKRLAFQLSNQYDDMVNQIVKLESLKSSNNDSTISEILEIAEFSIFDSNRDKFNLNISHEIPTYLSLIDTSGMTLYSFNFNLNSTEDFDQLMSGFLIAINSVISRLFSSSGFIERIKHKEYTITLYKVIEPIYICYAYKGPSYHAQTKINQLKDELLNHPFMQSILEASNKKRTLNQSEIGIVSNLITETFNVTLMTK